ncbi:MAG: hypothetical protein FWC26_07680 [Fibromonadales bacterium]|nr:hypothetical protein [Fibromonadales bacterium]
MKTRNISAIAGVVLLCSGLAFAQDISAFVGKWKALDRAKDKHEMIIEFKEDGKLVVLKYQTWGDGLVNCEGTGTYSANSGKLAFQFELYNEDRRSKFRCGTNGRVGSQTYEFIGNDQFELTGNENDGQALLRSFFKKGTKADKEDYYRVFNRVKD